MFSGQVDLLHSPLRSIQSVTGKMKQPVEYVARGDVVTETIAGKHVYHSVLGIVAMEKCK